MKIMDGEGRLDANEVPRGGPWSKLLHGHGYGSKMLEPLTSLTQILGW